MIQASSISSTELERELRQLGVATRQRRRCILAWTAACAVAALAIALVGWETALGPAGGARAAGYLLVAATGLAVATRIARRWRAPAPAPTVVARRLERLFPQVRGRLRDSLAIPPGSLGLARASGGRAWLARRGRARLDRALAADDGRTLVGWRRFALALALVAAAASALQPAAARRVAAAMGSPGALWRASDSAWMVDPGDAMISYGERVSGRARFQGPAADGPLVLETRTSASAWRAETIAGGSTGRWTWPSVEVDLRYRLRFGPFASPIYRIAVEAPLALVRAEVRRPGGAWVPLGGSLVPAGSPLQVRGEGTRPLARAFVRMEREAEIALEVDETTFAGTVRLPVGGGEVALHDRAGHEIVAAPFRAVAASGAYVDVVRPSEDPAVLAAQGVWLEVRAGAPAGLVELEWQAADGRSGALADVAGVRDTTVAAIAPLAAGRAPGDTVWYRVVARPAVGPAAATPWRTALVAGPEALRVGAAAARSEADRGLKRAVSEAREAAAEVGTGAADREERNRAQALDRRLQAAADSLASTIERTLGDPGIRPGLAERLEGYRRLLEGAGRASLAPSAGLPPDPTAALSARAGVLEAIRRGLAEVDTLMALAAAADTLARLADVEEELAGRTRRSTRAELASEIAPRQTRIDQAAREITEPLPDSIAAAISEPLEEAGAQVTAGDPAAAAGAQEAAAGALSRAARDAEGEVEGATARSAAVRAAMDRAGAETLFLAERQRELAGRLGPATRAEQHAERVARQRVVSRGLEATVGTLVEAIGGRPAGVEIGERLAQAVFATRYAEQAVATPPDRIGRGADPQAAVEDASRALTLLSRAFLLPDAEGGAGIGAGAAGRSGVLARELDAMAGAERSIADALAAGRAGGRPDGAPPSGGDAEAAAAQRVLGERFGGLAEELEAIGVDPRTVDALEAALERAASRLERGLPGAESETELRSLARRFADVGRIVERSTEERRRSETARPFLPADPPPLPRRATARRIDPAAALAPWVDLLPRDAVDPGRDYLERLAEEGVRAPEDGQGPDGTREVAP